MRWCCRSVTIAIEDTKGAHTWVAVNRGDHITIAPYRCDKVDRLLVNRLPHLIPEARRGPLFGLFRSFVEECPF
jgi:hypothetical protein